MSRNTYNAKLRTLALMRAKTAANLKAEGRTWAEVGKLLGVSRQRAQQIASRLPE